MPELHLPPVHPEHLIAYSLVHYPRSAVAHQPIMAIGALEVELGCGTDVRFTRHQKFYVPESFPHPLHDILDLVRKNTYFVSANPSRAHRSQQHSIKHQMWNEILQYGLVSRHCRPTHFIGVQERMLRAFAGDFAFSLAASGKAKREKARVVSDRAQAIWLTWSFECLHSDPDYDSIMAAYRGWRVLCLQR